MSNQHKQKAIFITGTDTSVGKTFVSALLLDYLNRQGVDVAYQKWVSTGDDKIAADLDYCAEIAGINFSESVETLVPYRFKLPASPHLAAEQENLAVDPQRIIKKFHQLAATHELVIVEGVGGLHVPLTRTLLLADLLQELAIPTLIVARSGLGTLNHTLLSLEALRKRKIPALGVIFSDSREHENEQLVCDNLKTIAQMGDTTVFGRMKRCKNSPQARAEFYEIGRALEPHLISGRKNNKSSILP